MIYSCVHAINFYYKFKANNKLVRQMIFATFTNIVKLEPNRDRLELFLDNGCGIFAPVSDSMASVSGLNKP